MGLLNELAAKCVVLGLYLLISKPGCTTYSIQCMYSPLFLFCSIVLRLYSILYVVGNEQARCTVLATMYDMHYTEKLHNFCHGCATAHSMNLHYVQ